MTMTSGEGKPESTEEKLLRIIAEQSKAMEAYSKRIESLEKSHGAKSGGITAKDVAEIAKVVAEANKKDQTIDYEAGVLESQIDPSDFDEVGVRFTCPAGGYVLSDDIRKGRRVILPYNKKTILFEHATTRRQGSGRYEISVPISVYTSHSKIETEWIRNHSLYGIIFYETSNEAAHADAIKATKLARIMGHIKNYEHIELIRVCRQYNIAPNEDANITRSTLALKILEKEEELSVESTTKILAETYKNTLIKKDESLSN